MEHPIAHPPEFVGEIMGIILGSGLHKVYYTGRADEGLLRALIAHRASLAVSVMDMPDQWGVGYVSWYDEEEFGENLPRERPDWLQGIPFYQEGAPSHEIALRDCKRHTQRALMGMVSQRS